MNKRLLFAGVSTMREHAGQHKLYFIAQAFSRAGIPVAVMAPDWDENRAFLENNPTIDGHLYSPGSVASDLRRRSAILGKGGWSAVWVIGVGLRSLAVRRRAVTGVPLIQDFDELPSLIESFGPLRRFYLRLVQRAMIAQADGFTCASAFLENIVRRRRPELKDRLLRLPVAISEEEHRVEADLVSRLRARDPDRPVLLYIGSLSRFYEDQIIEVIYLARRLHEGGANALVRIVGGGPHIDYFKAKARSLNSGNSLEFVGHVGRSELASYMEAARVLVFPFPATPFNLSRCPTKAFHYAAANRPVVTNRTGEVASLFGESAWYYPERDVDALADCCAAALKAAPGFRNGIPFATLTWDARARTFARWLSDQGWTRNAPQVAHATALQVVNVSH